jgi:hypothetical protein
MILVGVRPSNRFLVLETDNIEGRRVNALQEGTCARNPDAHTSVDPSYP